MRVAPRMLGVQADPLEQLADPVPPRRAFGELVGVERLADDLGDASCAG